MINRTGSFIQLDHNGPLETWSCIHVRCEFTQAQLSDFITTGWLIGCEKYSTTIITFPRLLNPQHVFFVIL